MNTKQFAVIPLIVGVLALLIQIVDQLLLGYVLPEGNCGFGWIAFQSWALYFLGGCNVKGGIKVFLAYLAGITGSILIFKLGGALSPALGFFGVPVAVGFITFCLIFFERTVWLGFVPAMFISAGAYFGFMSYVPNATLGGAFLTEMIYCVIGLIFGYVTICLRSAYEAKVAKEE